MTDLSDWIWLAVIVLWVVLKGVSRLFGAKAGRDAAETPSPASTPGSAPASERYPGGEPERVDDIGPAPIEPR